VPCLQPHEWSQAVFSDVTRFISEYDNENEWMLDEDASESLKGFFLGSGFKPFLVALDKDATRVAERADLKEKKKAIKARMHQNGTREVNRWQGECKAFDAGHSDDKQFPKIPIPYDMVIALSTLVEDADMKDTTVGLLTDCMLHTARYIHGLHYKIDELRSMGGGAGGAPEPVETQAALFVKHPWLSECDDHVFNLPPGATSRELARTAPVMTCVFALNVVVRV
jgi:hypothetical protein